MEVLITSESELELARALRNMRAALDILDDIDAPGDIAWHLDLAICRLEKILGTGSYAQTSVQSLISQVEDEFATGPGEVDAETDPWELQPV
ncbi:MAG: hypothetical protein M3Q19_12790 [Pseudomonadota bacterium]|nr:hypothetical protein [Pseudomonadota bacterium]